MLRQIFLIQKEEKMKFKSKYGKKQRILYACMAIILSLLMLLSSCTNKDSDLSPDGKNAEKGGENNEEKSTSSLGLSQTSFIFLTDGETTEVYIDGIAYETKLTGCFLDDYYVYELQTRNLRQDVRLCATYDKNHVERLYHVTKDKVTFITDDSLIYVYVAAENGDICYVTDKNELYLFDGDKSSKIDTNINGTCDTVISPNGKAILYRNNNNELCLYTNNQITKLGNNYYPVGVSDDCKYIYVARIDEDNSGNSSCNLYNMNINGETNIIASNVGNLGFNCDNSEIIFTSYDNNTSVTYICVKGTEKTKLFSGTYKDVLPNSRQSYGSYPIKSFIGAYLMSYDCIYKVDENGTATKIADDVSSAQISNNEKGIAYVIYDDVNDVNREYLLYTEKADSNGNSVLICDNLQNSSDYCISNKFSYIYYIDEDHRLYRSTVDGKTKTRIADDVYSIEGMMQNGKLFYKDDDNTLYSYNGKNAKKIAEDVDSFCVSGSKAYYSTISHSYYYTSDGENFTFLKSGVSTSRYID